MQKIIICTREMAVEDFRKQVIVHHSYSLSRDLDFQSESRYGPTFDFLSLCQARLKCISRQGSFKMKINDDPVPAHHYFVFADGILKFWPSERDFLNHEAPKGFISTRNCHLAKYIESLVCCDDIVRRKCPMRHVCAVSSCNSSDDTLCFVFVSLVDRAARPQTNNIHGSCMFMRQVRRLFVVRRRFWKGC